MKDTIVAISSGNINQPISIIRLSGPEAFQIVQKVFSGKTGKHQTITYGHIVKNQKIIDEVLVSWFHSPNTFTGEDIVEINAHGGLVNTMQILRLILVSGARLAEPGEFSRRAFLNGKMDLIKAEAIHDLIFANSEEQASLAIKKFDSTTSQLIDNLKAKLLNIIATIETNIDYPEYDDVEIITREVLLPKLINVNQEIDEIISASKSSKYISEGIKVVIAGRPNVGKSSLLNALINEEKAIVSNSPGTTRDIVEGSVQIGQVVFSFKDTAGIRATGEEIEKIGIQKTKQQIKNADLVIHLLDPLTLENNDDQEIENLSKHKIYIKVYNKSDLKKTNGISISVKNNQLGELMKEIERLIGTIDLDNHKIFTNNRQLSLIEKAKQLINEAITSLKNNIEPNVVIIDIQQAWESLANILGKADQADLLNEIFSNFCLGK